MDGRAVCGHSTDPKLSVTDQLSGGSAFCSTSEAGVMAEMATALGVEDNDLVIESKSRNTKDQASFIHNLIGNDKFILITSASHMARSMALFQSKGMNPIPAPIGYRVKRIQKISPSMFFPSGKSIDKMERVVYGYMGIVCARLRG